MHTASYPLPHNARFTHNGLCYQIWGFSAESYATHQPLVVIDDPNRFTMP